MVLATGATWWRAPMGRDGRAAEAIDGPILTPDDIMAGLRPTGYVLVHDTEGGYIGGLIAEALRTAGAEVTFSTPALSHSGFLALTLEQSIALTLLTALGVHLLASHDLTGFRNGSARLRPTLGGATIEIAADHLVFVADRIPEAILARDLLSIPERLAAAGILSVNPIGDCQAPGLIAHAVYAGHQLAQSL